MAVPTFPKTTACTLTLSRAVCIIMYRGHHIVFETGPSGLIWGIFGVISCSVPQIVQIESDLN